MTVEIQFGSRGHWDAFFFQKPVGDRVGNDRCFLPAFKRIMNGVPAHPRMRQRIFMPSL